MNPTEAFSEALSRLQAGNPEDALSLCDDLVAALPSEPGVWQLAGLAAFALARFAIAAQRFRRARVLEPSNAAHAVNLANALIKLDRDAEAAAEIRTALELDPRSPDAQIAMGTLARRAGRLDEAVDHANRAIALRAGSYEAWANRGRALHELGRFDEATRSYEQAVEINPLAAPAHAQMALTLLLTGNFERGWQEYEWRGEGSDVVSRRRFPQPDWNGEQLEGATLFVHAEQGFGDTIQFARFLPSAEARGARAVLEVQPALKRLFSGFSESIRVIARGEPIPPFAREIRLMSLPRVLGTEANSIPPPVRFQSRRISLSLSPDSRPIVGLSWAGSPAHENDSNRSIPPEVLTPLGAIAGVRFVSVQKDSRGPVPSLIESDLGPQIGDFADLASLLEALDLLITVDSAPAHLMGSLNRPVWVLLPNPPDWRWLLGRDDSPWYPSARLFRQRDRGDWTEVLGRVCAALSEFRDEKAGSRRSSSH